MLFLYFSCKVNVTFYTIFHLGICMNKYAVIVFQKVWKCVSGFFFDTEPICYEIPLYRHLCFFFFCSLKTFRFYWKYAHMHLHGLWKIRALLSRQGYGKCTETCQCCQARTKLWDEKTSKDEQSGQWMIWGTAQIKRWHSQDFVDVLVSTLGARGGVLFTPCPTPLWLFDVKAGKILTGFALVYL